MKKISISKDKLNNIKIIMPLLFVMSLTSFFVNLDCVSEASHYMILFYSFVFCLFATLLIANNFNNKWERIIVYLGFILHVVFILIDYYITFTPHHGSDVFGYYNHSKELFYGYKTRDYGGLYSRFVALFMKIFGANMYLSQFINTFYWLIAIIIVKKTLDELNVKGCFLSIGLLLVSTAPNYLFVSTVLLRESLISLFTVLSFYYFIKWSKRDRLSFAFISTSSAVLATIMHSGLIVIIITELLFFCIYSPKKRKIYIDRKKIFLALLFALIFTLLWSIPFTHKLLFSRFQKSASMSLIDVINSIIGRKVENYKIYGATTNADYLIYSYINSYYDLFIRTVRRMLLFWAYPLPGFIRNAKDMISFLTDSSLYVIAVVLMVLAVMFKRNDIYIIFGLIFSFLFDAMFAWGVSNGGTAMRHRVKIVNIIVIIMVYSLEKILEAKRQKSSCIQH